MQRRSGRLALLTLGSFTVALPAWANNPPRPDGLLYLLLLLPVVLAARGSAGVPRRPVRLGGRLGRAAIWVLALAAAAAGGELGLVATFGLVLWGLVNAVEVARHGRPGRRAILATLVVLATFGAAIGYVVAAVAGSSGAIAAARQRRTMADMRSLGTEVLAALADQPVAAAGKVDPSDDLEPPPIVSRSELQDRLGTGAGHRPAWTDGWGHPFEIRLDETRGRIWIRSPGADGEWDGRSCVEGPFDPSEHDRDIEWRDGSFRCWPGFARGSEPGPSS